MGRKQQAYFEVIIVNSEERDSSRELARSVFASSCCSLLDITNRRRILSIWMTGRSTDFEVCSPELLFVMCVDLYVVETRRQPGGAEPVESNLPDGRTPINEPKGPRPTYGHQLIFLFSDRTSKSGVMKRCISRPSHPL